MAEVLGVPLQLDGYYHSSSPRCRSPQPPYGLAPPAAPFDDDEDAAIAAIDTRAFYQPFSSHRIFSPEPPSSISSSPELPSVIHSAQSSGTSSVASSICLDEPKFDEYDPDDCLFPVYEYDSPAPLTDPPQRSEPEPATEEVQETVTPTEMATESKNPGVSPADDTFVRHEPTRHVDYLSHEWKEEDIWASWRYMVRKRAHFSNAVRLENAAWRQWGKAKYQLSTVSPAKLNWLKDCDVTWLYGPLSTAPESTIFHPPLSPPASPDTNKMASSDNFFKTKPILKKRSMSEIMLQRSLSNSNLLKQATAAIESQKSGAAWESKSSGLPSPAASASVNGLGIYSGVASTGMTSSLATGCQSPSAKKHIHFNDSVQQCIAVVREEDEYDDDSELDEEDDEVHEDGESSDDDVRTVTRGRGRSRSRSRDRKSKSPQTIAPLPSTTLKYVDTPPPPPPKSSFLSLNAFFSSSRKPQAQPEQKKPAMGPKTYILEEDDDDLADLGWLAPNSFGTKPESTSSTTIATTSWGRRTDPVADNSDDDDFQLPNYSYEEGDDEAANGIFGRAVDAVNTARDIAHVLWNVGWSR